jgi:hypothetical protein
VHSWKVVLQVQPHVLFVQLGCECVGPVEGHAIPHLLQFCGSVAVSTHEPLQMACPASQPLTQPVPLQRGVFPLQVTLHAPQFPWVVMLVGQPAFGLVVQFCHPDAHVTAHWPAVHCAPMTCGSIVQSLPHEPQFVGPSWMQAPLHAIEPGEQLGPSAMLPSCFPASPGPSCWTSAPASPTL